MVRWWIRDSGPGPEGNFGAAGGSVGVVDGTLEALSKDESCKIELVRV